MNQKYIHVVIVEDNLDLRDEMQFQLSSDRLHVVAMSDGAAFDEHLLHHPCDIAILDIGLPGEDGLSIANRLHQTHSEIGIIMLTARSGLDTRLKGLENGADIYLVKPIKSSELQAQIFSLFRRVKTHDVKVNGKWVLKQVGRELITPQGVSIMLTHMEGAVMNALAKQSGTAVIRESLIRNIAIENPQDFDHRRLEVCISRLRQKIQNNMDANIKNSVYPFELPLKTVRSVGYIFTEEIIIDCFEV
jgi:DNA-binding response OmpR family regulator